jgi:hypothetical protein
MLGVKEARQMSCSTVYGRPAKKAYEMGRKLSQSRSIFEVTFPMLAGIAANCSGTLLLCKRLS